MDARGDGLVEIGPAPRATCCGSRCVTTAWAEDNAGRGAEAGRHGHRTEQYGARLHELCGPKSALELADYPAESTLVSLLIRSGAPGPSRSYRDLHAVYEGTRTT